MLTELKVRSTKCNARLKKLSDGAGLQLWITPDGAKRWRLAYRFAGAQKVLALGVYPGMSLKDARARGQDLELDPADEEPSLGATHSANQEDAWRIESWYGTSDREFDGETAPSADSEPSLGSSELCPQVHWA